MSTSDSDQLVDKITEGVKLSIQRLIERTKKEDGELVISKDGKIVRIKARELKINQKTSYLMQGKSSYLIHPGDTEFSIDFYSFDETSVS